MDLSKWHLQRTEESVNIALNAVAALTLDRKLKDVGPLDFDLFATWHPRGDKKVLVMGGSSPLTLYTRQDCFDLLATWLPRVPNDS